MKSSVNTEDEYRISEERNVNSSLNKDLSCNGERSTHHDVRQR